MDKPKEVKIKEKWLQKELNDWMRKKEGIRELLFCLSEQSVTISEDARGIWDEVIKRYNLDPTARHTYDKPTNIVRELPRYGDIIAKGFEK